MYRSVILPRHRTVVIVTFSGYSGDAGFSSISVDLKVLVLPRARVLLIPLMKEITRAK